MPVKITNAPSGAALVWNKEDDPRAYISQAVNTGRLEAALTALGLDSYSDIVNLEAEHRAEILRGTAALNADLTRRVRALTVACRESGMTWGVLAVHLTDDMTQRSTARSTYEAGVRQLGQTHLPMTTYAWSIEARKADGQDEMQALYSGTITSASEALARRDAEYRVAQQGWTPITTTLTPVPDEG
ncbi:hypothetical protein G3I34_23020 [Streptomyces sp. SID8014]|uniref:hypothetical protein n=1 Tax=Streptomyces sp. SID8014 TaxID=2706097 RepID=UPI0013BDE996|nr:hypothetical protein [Streptomyces sp. SID8014]NEC15087.1 hypothetical protein [Streptomyces sp. SID8014]